MLSRLFLVLIVFSHTAVAIEPLMPLAKKRIESENAAVAFASVLLPRCFANDRDAAFERAVARRITHTVVNAQDAKISVDGKTFNTALTLRSPDGRIISYQRYLDRFMEHSTRQAHELIHGKQRFVEAGIKTQLAFAKSLSIGSLALAKALYNVRGELDFKNAIILGGGVSKFLLDFFANDKEVQEALLAESVSAKLLFPSRQELFHLQDSRGAAIFGRKLLTPKEAGKVESLTAIMTITPALMDRLANAFSKVEEEKKKAGAEFAKVISIQDLKPILEADFATMENSLRTWGYFPRAELLSMRISSFLLGWQFLNNPKFRCEASPEPERLLTTKAMLNEHGTINRDDWVRPPDFSKLTFFKNKSLASDDPGKNSLDLSNIKIRFGQDYPMIKNIKNVLYGNGSGFFYAITSTFGFFPVAYTWPTITPDQAKILSRMFSVSDLMANYDDGLLRSVIFSNLLEYYPRLAQDLLYSHSRVRMQSRVPVHELQRFGTDGRSYFQKLMEENFPELKGKEGITHLENIVNDFIIQTDNHYPMYPRILEFTDLYICALFFEWLKEDPNAISMVTTVLKNRAVAFLGHRFEQKLAELLHADHPLLRSAVEHQQQLIFNAEKREDNHEAIKQVINDEIVPRLKEIKGMLAQDPATFYRIANLSLFGHDSRNFDIYSKRCPSLKAQVLIDMLLGDSFEVYQPMYKYKKERVTALDLAAVLAAKDKTVLGQMLEWENRQDKIFRDEGFEKQHGPIMFRGVATFTNDLDQAERFVRALSDRGEFIPTSGIFQSTNPGSDLHDMSHPICEHVHGATNTLAVKSSSKIADVAHLYASRFYFSPKGTDRFFAIKVLARHERRPLVNVSSIYQLEDNIFDDEDALANIFPEEHILSIIYYPPTADDVKQKRFRIARVLTHEGYLQGRLNVAKISEQDMIVQRAMEKLNHPERDVYVSYLTLNEIIQNGLACLKDQIHGSFVDSLSYGRWIAERDYPKRRRIDTKNGSTCDKANPKLGLDDEWRVLLEKAKSSVKKEDQGALL